MEAACWTCRNRTIQCDLSGTPCAKCVKAGLECFEQRPLRWVSGVAIRGKQQGRILNSCAASRKASAVKRRNPAERNPRHRQSSTLSVGSPLLSLQDPRMQRLSASSRFYIDYFRARICKLFILHDSDQNPFRNLLTLSMNNSTLQYSIIAVASRHFANSAISFDHPTDSISHQSIGANLDALRFKKKIFEGLRLDLSCTDLSDHVATMATILLLIFLDLLESGIDGWKCHVQGARQLVNLSHSLIATGAVLESRHDDATGMVAETKQFLFHQFSLIATLGEALSASGSKTEASTDFDDSKHKESIVRSSLGCPAFLRAAIRDFSRQRCFIETLQSQERSEVEIHIQRTVALMDLTRRFDCLEWSSTTVAPSNSDGRVGSLAMLAEAYKTATLLYGARILRAFGKNAMEQSERHKLACELLNTIESLKGDQMMFKCLLWPTFIAGTECQYHKELVSTQSVPPSSYMNIGEIKILYSKRHRKDRN
ncbi:hypothetical protein NQ176_g897 [Zarea fungicola]|uniref:Uncharacterized protein n=1 Tax=Zarea fungicola TaxID=93591 RepID=A0ACC1NV08_9HYPO|nr:hypothetical protein NQ176_g897 [Lecanicillium fungicola]